MATVGLWAIVVVVAAAAVYAAYGVLLYVNQRGMMYLPTPEVTADHAAVIRLASDGETVKIWRLGEVPDARHALLYFGGNAEDVALNIPTFSAWFPDHTMYLGNYRGYGGSTGAPSEAGLVADALALYDYARARHGRISLIGRSLGSGVAAQVAAQREVHKLVLVTPFDSALNVARQLFPLFPVAWLLKDHYDTTGRVSQISAPLLVVIAAEDGIIPRARSDALAGAFPAGQITVRVFEDANHNNIAEAAGYADALRGFVNE